MYFGKESSSCSTSGTRRVINIFQNVQFNPLSNNWLMKWTNNNPSPLKLLKEYDLNMDT